MGAPIAALAARVSARTSGAEGFPSALFVQGSELRFDDIALEPRTRQAPVAGHGGFR